MATTNPDPPASSAPAAGLENRVDTIEQEQKRQGGMLEQILARLPGPGGGAQPPAGPGGTSPGQVGTVDLAEIQRQVREEITAADRRRAAEQTETKWRDGVNETLERLRRERRPREPEQGVRGFVQRALIGRQ